MTWHHDSVAAANFGPSRKDLRRNRANYCRRSVLLDVIQRVDLSRLTGRSECFEEKRRLHAILMRILREFPSRARASDEDLALEVLAHSGMMKEILHSLPRPWPEDLPERVTRLFLHGLGVGQQGRSHRMGRSGGGPPSGDRPPTPPRRRRGSARP